MTREYVSKVDIEKIMEEIRREIAEKGCRNDEISFSDMSIFGPSVSITHSNRLDENVMHLQISHNVSAYRPLESNRTLGSLVVIVKKVIRKLTKFYIEPVVADQNEINRQIASCIKDMYIDIELLNQRVKHLEKENEQLKSMQNVSTEDMAKR
ncbi:MAG: hypothetical protein FWD05_04400 [Oscillospiraceae bacterium]|nr:hypothetical protein [Oscillospiraceae bacterium]